MSGLRFRPATGQDIKKFYPDLRHTFRAWVAEDETGVLGIGGVYYDGPYIIAFSRFEPGLEKYPLGKARGLKKIMEIVKDRHCIAIADEKFRDAPGLLERIGFKHVEGRVYKWTPVI